MASDKQSRNAEIIAGELQASIRKTRIASAPRRVDRSAYEPDGPIEVDGDFAVDLDVELGMLHSNSDISDAPFTSHRRFLGPFIIAIKNFARELLIQLLERQSIYNRAAAELITHLKRKVDALSAEQARMARRLAALEARLSGAASSESRRTRDSGVSGETEGPRSVGAGFDDHRAAPWDAAGGGRGRGRQRA